MSSHAFKSFDEIVERLRDEENNFTIDFHLPSVYNRSNAGNPVGVPAGSLVSLNCVDELCLHTQLVCWCLVQRFWYYVLDCPQCSDREYDYIEATVKQLELLYPQLETDNKYSPTRTPGSSALFSYPSSIVNSIFNKDNLGCYVWQYRGLTGGGVLPLPTTE